MPSELRSLAAEHALLKKRLEELLREHMLLVDQHPFDRTAHTVHRMKLREMIADLRTHKIRQTGDGPF
jgi:hypothetical protein